jgi:hypothetical protein
MFLEPDSMILFDGKIFKTLDLKKDPWVTWNSRQIGQEIKRYLTFWLPKGVMAHGKAALEFCVMYQDCEEMLSPTSLCLVSLPEISKSYVDVEILPVNTAIIHGLCDEWESKKEAYYIAKDFSIPFIELPDGHGMYNSQELLKRIFFETLVSEGIENSMEDTPSFV